MNIHTIEILVIVVATLMIKLVELGRK